MVNIAIMSKPTIHVRARFDGRVLIREHPLDVPEGAVLELWGTSEGERQAPELGTAAGRVTMAEDFDATPEEFEACLEDGLRPVEQEAGAMEAVEGRGALVEQVMRGYASFRTSREDVSAELIIDAERNHFLLMYVS